MKALQRAFFMPSADAQEGTTQAATIPRDRRQAPTPRSPSETPPGPPEATPARRTTRDQETAKSEDAVRGRRRPLTASFIIPLLTHAGRQKTAQRPHRGRERAFQAIGHTEAPTQGRGPAAVRRGDGTTPSPGSTRPVRRGAAATTGDSSTTTTTGGPADDPTGSSAGEEDPQQHHRRPIAPAKLDPRRTRSPPRRASAPAPMEAAQADPVKRVFFARRPPAGEGTEGTTTASGPGAKAGSKAKAPSHICNGAIPAAEDGRGPMGIRRENTLSAPFCDF